MSTTTMAATSSRDDADTHRLLATLAEELRVLVVAGLATGIVVVGIGSRLAMLALRLTSPDSVRGVQSDDDFQIGRFTLGGTYNLLLLGAAVGFIGAAVYRAVAPRLMGPQWFRRFTTGAASGAVAGSMLVHDDGIDFHLLKPAWFAVALFVALPALFGVVIGMVVDSVAPPDSWTRRGRWRWLLPIVLVVPFLPIAIPIAMAAGVLMVWVPVRSTAPARAVRTNAAFVLAVRAAWLSIAVLGLVALINDVQAVL